MNKRINELYQKAHSVRSWDSDPWRNGNPPTVFWEGEISAKKFAELIIKECIEQIHGADVGDLKAKSYYLDKVAEHIENYFGIDK